MTSGTVEGVKSQSKSVRATPRNPVKAIAKRNVHPLKNHVGDLERANELLKEGQPVALIRITTRTLRKGESPVKIGYARGAGKNVLIFELKDLKLDPSTH